MIGYFERLRATRTASAVILPLVERTRVRKRGLSSSVWRQPYVIGFISSLITLIATRATLGRLDANRLGNIQLDSWSAVTGERDEQVGEDICMLSASQDEAFKSGCRNAGVFLSVYSGEPLQSSDDIFSSEFGGQQSQMQQTSADEEELEIYGKGGALACFLWQQFFDAQIQ